MTNNQSEEFFKALVENSREMLTMIGEDGKVIYESPAIARYLGYSIETDSEPNGFVFIHPDDHELVKQTFSKAVRTPGTPFFVTTRLKTKAGNYIHVEGTITSMLHIPDVNGIVTSFYDITKRKDIEESLIKAQENFVSLVNSVKGIVWEAEANTLNFGFVSKQAEDILGYPIEQWTTEENFWENHIHEDDKEWVINFRKDSINQKRNHDCEYRMIASDDRVLWIQDSVTVILENNLPSRVRGLMLDITQRKIAEYKVIAREKYFRALIEHSSSAIILFDEQGKFIYQSPVVEKIVGYTVEDESHTSIFQFIHPDELAEFVRLFEELLLDPGGSISGEFRFLHFKGEYIWLRGTVTNMLHDKNINALIANYLDISDRKLMEEALIKSEANLHTIFDNADTGYIFIDTGLNILSFNKPAENFTNDDLHKHLKEGTYAIDYFPEERQAFMKRKMLDALNGTTMIHELKYTQPDGSNRWYFMRFYPVYNQEKVIGVILSLNDVTERKMSEIHRQQITHDLIQRSKDQEQFTYIISHNLRAPVAHILGVSNLINEPDLSEEDREHLIKGLASSAQKLDEVISDLNQILQVKKDISENKEEILFSEVVKNIELSIEQLIKKEDVKIREDFSEVDRIVSLKSYINSIFYNLISNSIKYRKQGVPPLIEIKSQRLNNKIVLTFKDNGLGIDLKKRGGEVFGLYKRFHTFVEGKGMGLYMVKTQVETLGGAISVKSEVNEGTEFTIEFEI